MPWQDSNLQPGKGTLVIRWSFRQALHDVTEAYQLDGGSDLTSKDDAMQHGVDGWEATSHP